MKEDMRYRVGTTQGLYDFGDQVQTWFDGEPVRALAREHGDWWTLIGEGEVWRQETGGEWIQEAGSPAERARCLLVHDSGLLVGTDAAQLLRLQAQNFERLEAFESAPTRDEWFTPWGGPPAMRSMTAAPDGTLFVNVHVGGILRSADSGATWDPTIDIHSDVHEIHYDEGSGLLLAASARGLGVSQDRGDSWEFHTEGLHGTYLRAVAVVDETLIVSASTGAHSSRAAVYRRPLWSEEPFERCSLGLPQWFSDNIDTHCLAAAGHSVVLGTESGEVFASDDRGETWRAVAQGLPPVRCLAVG